MVVSHNLIAMNSSRMLNLNTVTKSKTTEKLSSGYKINRAADDAAGLAISEKMRRQIRGLTQASTNCQDGISFNQIADGAMNEIYDMLHRLEELSVKAANGTNADNDRLTMQEEVIHIQDEINDISVKTTFNEIPVFGRERNKSEYNLNSLGEKDIIKIESYYVEGNNYGITEVLGKEHIYNGKRMANPLILSGSGWISTGNIIYSRGSLDNVAVFLNDKTNNTFSVENIKAAMFNKLTDLTQTNDSNGYVYSIKFEHDGYKDLDGNYLPTLCSVYCGHNIIPGDDTSYHESKLFNISLRRSRPGESGLDDGTTYGSAWLDFSGLGTDYELQDLYDQGFNSTCSHGCNKYYSVLFTDDSLGTSYQCTGDNSNPVLKVNISGCNTGEDIVKAVMNAANNSPYFINHWQQYAYNKNEPNKLYLYDNTPLSKSYGTTFEPVSRTEEGVQVINKTVVHLPGTTNIAEYSDKDIWIQAGTESNDGFYIKRAIVDGGYLGTDSINVSTMEGSLNAIDTLKKAIILLSNQRTMVGAQQNRLEHTIKNLDNVVENTTASESQIRDTDMAKEMVKFSNHNVLEQIGHSMLAQANQSNQAVLALL